MTEELPPSLFNILRGDLRDTRGEINGRLDNLARDMVTSAMLAQVQANQKERDERQDARLLELEREGDERDREARRLAEEQRKDKAQRMFAVAMSALAVVGSIIGGIVIWTVTQGLQQIAGG